MTKSDVLEMTVSYLGVKLDDALKEIEDTEGSHARFVFLESLMHTT